MPRYTKHIFICENERRADDPRGCCSSKGAKEVIDLFKKRIKELGLSASIRANGTGCLDACALGCVAVVYPEQVWYGNIKLDDVEEIIQEHLLNNRLVDRLILKEKKYL